LNRPFVDDLFLLKPNLIGSFTEILSKAQPTLFSRKKRRKEEEKENGEKQRRRLKDLLASFEECEHKWLSEVGESCQRRYLLYWHQFKDWLVEQGFEWGAKGSEILKCRSDDLMLRHADPARWRLEDLGKKYYRSL